MSVTSRSAPSGESQTFEGRTLHCQLTVARLIVHLHFPEENANFHLDLELKGIVDTESCTANMMGTKLEVKMKKGEAGSWAKLDIPRPVAEREVTVEEAPKDRAV